MAEAMAAVDGCGPVLQAFQTLATNAATILEAEKDAYLAEELYDELAKWNEREATFKTLLKDIPEMESMQAKMGGQQNPSYALALYGLFADIVAVSGSAAESADIEIKQLFVHIGLDPGFAWADSKRRRLK